MFKIYYNNRQVGNAQINEEGLYYRFMCSCTLPKNDIYRISVTDGVNRQDLGICVPEDGKFTLMKRLPKKYFIGTDWSFTLLNKENPLVSVPVATGTPFAYLDKLETAQLHCADGQTEIVIDPVQDQQGSDQNQEYQNKLASQ